MHINIFYCVAPNTTVSPTTSTTKGASTTSGTTTNKPIVTTTGPTSPTTTSKPGSTTTTVKSNSTTPPPSPLSTKYNYTEVIYKSLLFYYAQRSGHLPTNDSPIPYRFDSALKDIGQAGEDLTGGYYDGKNTYKFQCMEIILRILI